MVSVARWQPGALIPWLMLLVLGAEAVTRFWPMNWVAVRSTWESAMRYSLASDMIGGWPGSRVNVAGRIERAFDPKSPEQGSFEIDQKIVNSNAFGDLASMGNLPAMRRYHVEQFTSDGFGFRNDRELTAPGPPDAVVFGTSFIAGGGNSDEMLLPMQLSKRSGLRVYNAGASGRDPDVNLDFPAFVLRTVRRLGMHEGVVFFDYRSGEWELKIPAGGQITSKSEPSALSSGAIADAARPLAAGLRRWFALSRLQLLAQRLYKSFQNDRFLPNIHLDRVIQKGLPNGETMLFLPDHTKTPSDDLIGPAVAYFRWMQDQLAKEGLTMVVLFVPRPVGIYGDMVNPPFAIERWLAHYDKLEQELRSAKIGVVNPISALRREARSRISSGEYLYHLDDSHWNREGIAVAVDEIAHSEYLSKGKRDGE